MSPHQTIAVAVRLFAVWLVIELLPGVVGFHTQLNGPNRLAFAVLVTVIVAGLVLGLWSFPLMIARRLLTSVPTDQASAGSPDRWLAMGCALIGLWTLTTTSPTLIYDFLILHFSADTLGTSSQTVWRIIYDIARLAIAAWLILGARGFRKLFWWAHNAGVGEPPNFRWSGL
jgi:hypothetical protein